MDACSEIMTATHDNAVNGMTMSRKEKRKLLKKEKRKQIRKEIAVREKEEEEARLNDAEEQSKLRQLEKEEVDRMERDRREFEERERRFLEALELNRKREQEEYEQEQERRKLAEEYRAKQVEVENPEEIDGGSDWEYVEEGPAEIIWQGNEIIVKKKRVRVPKNNLEQNKKEDVARPISNPLAPQYETFEDYKSAQQILDTVSQQVPNFGTEQDKAHCPFHLKTGACRFGTRCSRVHFYPDKSCTLLVKNMYGGPGLVWEQDEGLELHTDEEIERSFEEFYEDVHTEFLKFGEIVNFKVCRNGSPHLRGNVYVHYKSLESAVLAYRSTNGRYFAGKQVGCEFVNLTRWKVAICGEYMKSRLKTCSRGTACNFIHCFRNPGGDYEWADWDRPPPRYWIKKMVALFGYEDGCDKQLDEESPDKPRSTSKRIRMDTDRRHMGSRSRELDSRHARGYDGDYDHRTSNGRKRRHTTEGRETSLDRDRNEQKMHSKENDYIRDKSSNVYSDDDQSDRDLRKLDYEEYNSHSKSHGRSRYHIKDGSPETDSDRDYSDKDRKERYHQDSRSCISKRHSDGRSRESDSNRERSIKDGRERYREDRTCSRQKARDSFKDFREETRRNDKHKKYRSKSDKGQDDDSDSCSSDSHGDTVVKNRKGYNLKRIKSSRWSNNELDCSDHDLLGDGLDRNENENYTSSKKTSLSEHSHGYRRDNKRGKRESSEHRKSEEVSRHKSDRRSSRHHRKDHARSNVILSDKDENSERIHKCRKESSWDQNKVDDQALTTHEGHHEREACEESTGGGNLGRQDNSVELEIDKEQACRRAALEKLLEKQLQKQPTPETSSHNVEGLASMSKVNDDQNGIEAETRKRHRI